MILTLRFTLLHLGVTAILLSSAILAAAAFAGPVGTYDWLRVGELRSSEIEVPDLPPERAAILSEDQAGYAELIRYVEMRVLSNGTIERRETEIRRFLNFDGVESGGDFEINVMPARESLTIETAYVITKEGTRLEVDPSILQVTDVVKPGLFLGLKRVVIPLPGLSPGATSVVVFSKRFRTSSWPLPWSMHVGLQSIAPVERFAIRVDWDPGVPRPAWNTTDEGLECEESTRRIVCDAIHRGRFRPDVDVRIANDVIPEFVVAETRTWSQVATDVGELVAQRVREGVPLKLVQDLVSESNSELEKFRQIFDFVANDIRYLGLEQGTGAVVPRAPATTLSRRFGDCKDKVTLLVALAKEAGLDAYPVLVGTQRQDLNALALPSSSYFDHMIVCLDLNNSETRCADPTVSNTAPEASALVNAGRIALKLRPSTTGPISMRSVPYGWVVTIDSNIDILCDGSTKTETMREFRSFSKIWLRKYLAEIPHVDRERFLVADDLRTRGTTVPSAVAISGLNSRTEPVRITTTHNTPAQVAMTAGYEHYDNDYWLRSYGLTFHSDNQVYPIWVDGLEVVSSRNYRLCGEFDAEHFGATLALEDSTGSFVRRYERTPEGVRVVSTLRVESGVAQPDRIAHTNGFLDQALDQSAIWFSTRVAQ